MSSKITPIGNDTKEDAMLNKYFISPVCTGFVEIGEDKYVLPNNFDEDLANHIRNFQIRDDDVFFLCHPKTGSTWLQELVWLINNDYDYDKLASMGPERFVFLEIKAIANPKNIDPKGLDLKVLEHILNSENKPGVRYIKTHLAWSLLPQQIQDGTKKPKIFIPLRNPQDVCISFYHFVRLGYRYTGNFEDFCQLFLTGRVYWGPYWKLVLSHWAQRHRDNILFIHYKDMKENFPAVARKVANFLNKPITDKDIEKLTDFLSFENMKSNKLINREITTDLLYSKMNLVVERTPFVRSGQEGGYKTVMTPEMIKKFEEWIKANSEGSGLEF